MDIYLGLDIDETLILTQRYYGLNDRPDDAEFYFESDIFKFALYKRNHLDEFLKFVHQNFNVFFYTRATEDYAKKIISFLGYEETPLLHREHTTRVEILNQPYENNKKYTLKKDLCKAADMLGTKINNIVFIDDVLNENELYPSECVIVIPEFDPSIEDSDLKIIMNHFDESLNFKNKIQYMRSLHFI